MLTWGVLSALLAFAALAAVLVAVPGPAVTLVMKNTVLRGPRSALRTALGVFCADLVWAGASVLGLTALLVASAPAFLAVKLIGAAYLIYLGVRLLRWRPPHADDGAGPGRPPAQTGGRAFREGFLCDLSNPKTALVYASVIPQFVDPGPGATPRIALFGVLFAVIGFGSLAGYAAITSSARTTLSRPRARKLVMRGSGGILTAFGVGVAASARA